MPPDRKPWRFGVLSLTGAGHLNPFLALAWELKSRGHAVTFFAPAKIEGRVRGAGFDFVSIPSIPRQEDKAERFDVSGIGNEIATLRRNLKRVRLEIARDLAEIPAALGEAGVDALLIDEIAWTGPTIAQSMGLPYFLISASIPHRLGWKISSWWMGYRYSATPFSWLQGLLLEVSSLRMRGPIRRELDRFRKKAGFGPVRGIERAYPCLAHITQLAERLHFRCKPRLRNLYYTGPWVRNEVRPKTDFPWERLDGRPIAYATLGTTRNAQPEILKKIAEACDGLDVQLVISLGNRLDPKQFEDLPGRPLVTGFAPQLELLKRAALVIFHGGTTTAFEALMEGTPMVAIPLAFDQPAVASRLKRLGVAEVLPVMRLPVSRIRRAVTRVLSDPKYRENAMRVRGWMRASHGAERAADIISLKLSGRSPKNTRK